MSEVYTRIIFKKVKDPKSWTLSTLHPPPPTPTAKIKNKIFKVKNEILINIRESNGPLVVRLRTYYQGDNLCIQHKRYKIHFFFDDNGV